MKTGFVLILLFPITAFSQNVGVGIITPQSKLHVSTGLSGATPFSFSPLTVENSDHTYINILSPNAKESGILFGKPDNAASGGIIYNHTATPNGLHFRTNGNNTRMVINNIGWVGIGVTTPLAAFHLQGFAIISGSVRMSSITLVAGGAVEDFLYKIDLNGEVGFRKGYQALGMNYIIAVSGNFPSPNPPLVNGTYIGEIKIFTGTEAPYGWVFCNGQLLPLTGNEGLFALIGTTFGGDGVNDFGVPDMRDAVPAGKGNRWELGERSN